MNSLVAGWVLVLVYSPVSSYFSGFSFEQKPSEEACLLGTLGVIGKEYEGGGIGWEVEMMGPKPRVFAAFCAKGFAPS
jgi:hypothetical protein